MQNDVVSQTLLPQKVSEVPNTAANYEKPFQIPVGVFPTDSLPWERRLSMLKEVEMTYRCFFFLSKEYQFAYRCIITNKKAERLQKFT